MPFSVCPPTGPPRANQSSPSSSRILKNGDKGQLIWSRLLRGFRNSQTSFSTEVASDLKAFPADQHGWTLLQYVDELLLGNWCRRVKWNEHSCALLSCGRWLHGLKGEKKIQICQEIECLGFHLSQEEHWLSPEREREREHAVWLSWFHQPNARLGSSLGPQVYVESEYLISPSCQNDFMRPQRRRARTSAMGIRTTEGFWRD